MDQLGTTAAALQAATPLNLDDKITRFLAGSLLATVLIYTVVNYHYSIRLNKIRIQRERDGFNTGS